MGAVNGRELRTAVCPLCRSFSSKRLTAFERHLVEAHGTTTQLTWDAANGGPGKCACGCGELTRWIGWWDGYSKVVTGHNGSIYAVCSPEEAKRISEKRSAALAGKEGWSKGLTKESDERIARRGDATSKGRLKAFEEGRIAVWSKGLTKETDERLADAAEHLKESYASGELTPWAKGLTKETDERLAAMASKVSLVLRQDNIRRKLDAIKRLSHDEIRGRVESGGSLRVLGGLEQYVNDAHKVIEVECVGCGTKFIGSLRSLQYGKCFKCSPGGSKAQEAIAKYVESLGMAITRNDRSQLEGGMEVDIFVPSRRIGVEYNGLYWHSHANKSTGYHANKTKLARKAGIGIVHVFEDEWRDKRPIVESIVASKLGLSTRSVGARKCRLVSMPPADRRAFFEANHMDGDTAAFQTWGLVDPDGAVVYALSLRKPFHRKHEGAIEVARCCPKLGHSIPGGLSRLVKAARTWAEDAGYDKLMTYVDTRLGGTGVGYERAGFVRTGTTPARFWWTDFTDRFNRFKYKADKARGLSEAAVAESAGVVKIWGCENVVYEMRLSPRP